MTQQLTVEQPDPSAVLEALVADLPDGGNPATAWLDTHADQIREVIDRLTSWSVLSKRLGSKPGNLYEWANRRGLRTPGPARPRQKSKGKRVSKGVEKPVTVVAGRVREAQTQLPSLNSVSSKRVVKHEPGVSLETPGWLRELLSELSGIPGVRVSITIEASRNTA